MKQPPVDYRDFRLSRLNEPRFSHLKLLLGWPVYFALYVLTERLIPAESCHVIHCPLDDVIPFCEVFVIPYVLWYFLIVGSLVYFARHHVESFCRLSKYLLITQAVAMAVYILFPNRQDLRPAEFPRDNVLTQAVALLYRLDTNTNVFPSLHVGYSLGIGSVWLKEKAAKPLVKAGITTFVILVCMSVAFIKQHSVLDFLGAIPMCILAELIVYRDVYFKKTRVPQP